ncbi:hypothetical protein SY83_16525 [Paenibacillus swuensis]|uniref:Zinc finger DksA/TraR C4-type domain-containing protein n=1 Tax=Paenibacillus swuensis TaxID=1178515 RepID=A0A172TKW5_9BACL|nr:TraR/DksA C4-type zinc finger protein [Paenibacillus swuensis]ANE47622.1 hypothetical protein SY83_16525 [Paenibacillus swuensis]
MHTLTKNQLQQLRKHLTEEQHEYQELVEGNEASVKDGVQEASGELSTYDNHPADSGTETFEKSRDLSMHHHFQDKLDAVNEALQRMETGNYGECIECGQKIPFERLEALPETSYCIDHAEHQADHESRPVEEEILEPLLPNNRMDDADAWKSVEEYGTATKDSRNLSE